jgi:hypothetical protein
MNEDSGKLLQVLRNVNQHKEDALDCRVTGSMVSKRRSPWGVVLNRLLTSWLSSVVHTNQEVKVSHGGPDRGPTRHIPVQFQCENRAPKA